MKTLGRKKLLIFDLDGTVVDTTHIGYRKVNKNLERLGFKPLDEEFLRRHWGKKAGDLFRIVCKEVGASAEQTADFIAYDMTMLEEYHPCPVMERALDDLRYSGCVLAIVTSRTRESLNNFAGRIGFSNYHFSVVQTADDHPHHKPSGLVFSPIIEWGLSRKFSVEEMVYFGDTINYDLAATRDSNPPLDFVAVCSGVNTVSEFITAGVPACRIVPSYEDFPAFLSGLAAQKMAEFMHSL